MSHKRIKRKKQDYPRSQPEAASPWPKVFFTPSLNAALSLYMKDDTLGDTERVALCLLRCSWGNWCGYAVQGGEDSLQINPEDVRHLTQLLFGPEPCPFCGRFADRQPGLPRNFRWHRQCLALAYARDAADFGDDEQKKWAGEVIGDMGVKQ